MTEAKTKKEILPVTGMTCAGCAASVESMLNNTEGVKNAAVNFADNSVSVEYSNNMIAKDLDDVLKQVGYGLVIPENGKLKSLEELESDRYQEAKNRLVGSSILTAPVFVLGMFFMEWEYTKWISLILTIPVLFWFGRNFFVNAVKKAKYGEANMDTLVALSTGIAFLFSLFNTFFPNVWIRAGYEAHVYYEAAAVIITFISVGKLLEERAKSNTSSAIKKLMGLQPKYVVKVENGKDISIKTSEVKPGDLIRVKPGQKIPVDARIHENYTLIDESMISGEPIPVEKHPGSRVFTGTINQKGSIVIEADKVGEDTILAQIIRTVREAQGSKASVQKLVDKIASVFVPTVLVIAIITFAVWMIFGGENNITQALLTSVSVLVVACPCALGLATPTAIMVGIGKGADNNILIRDAESLEVAHKVNAIVLDKTGTITEGKPRVVNEYWVNDSIKEKEILNELEKRSEHPLADAVTLHFDNIESDQLKVKNFKSHTALGVEATFEDGKVFKVGSLTFMQKSAIAIPEEIERKVDEFKNDNNSIIYFADQHKVKAVMGIRDKVKSSSAHAIADLKQSGIDVYMLTGDGEESAAFISKQVGIEEYHFNTSPADKSKFIDKLMAEGKVVAMVGDGINDSEALAKANVSIAMGKGSDIAMDTAMMTLITSDLRSIPKAFKLSSLTINGIRQNLFWAFVYNIIGIPVAAGVLYPINGFLLDPMIAGAAMALSSVSVVLNSLRLRWKSLDV